MEKLETRDVSPEFGKDINNSIAHPSIWLDMAAHDEIATSDKIIELLKQGDTLGIMSLVSARKHYWAGVRDGNRFMRNPFK